MATRRHQKQRLVRWMQRLVRIQCQLRQQQQLLLQQLRRPALANHYALSHDRTGAQSASGIASRASRLARLARLPHCLSQTAVVEGRAAVAEGGERSWWRWGGARPWWKRGVGIGGRRVHSHQARRSTPWSK